jgi:hypothetical protein
LSSLLSCCLQQLCSFFFALFGGIIYGMFEFPKLMEVGAKYDCVSFAASIDRRTRHMKPAAYSGV